MLNLCTYENRESHLILLKLLAISLEKKCNDFHLTIFLSKQFQDFSHWVQRYCKNVTLKEFIPRGKSWNIKPEILLLMLNEGATEAVWIDSDIIVLRDLKPLFQELGVNTLLVAQDALPYPQEEARAAFFDLKCVRKLEKSINSCFIRVTNTPNHLELLRVWEKLLSSDLYIHNQSLNKIDRPSYMIGDQDVLEAILASEASPNSSKIPLNFLTSGKEKRYSVNS